jgi:hypothetical protein
MAQAGTEVPMVDENAYWDSRAEVFRVPIHGSREFASMAILPSAPLLLSHLDTSAHNKKTPLGEELQVHLQIELAAALERHAHQAGTGITLLTHAQAKELL